LEQHFWSMTHFVEHLTCWKNYITQALEGLMLSLVDNQNQTDNDTQL